METRIEDVVVTRDGGQDCWDTTISAREIAKAFKYGLLAIDPQHQRGNNTVTDKPILKKDKIERWARELQEDKAIFGQLTWNFRPESSNVRFLPNEGGDGRVGTLIIRDGTAYLPDSVHRHYAINAAVESVTSGSTFDPSRRFSLRIWSVPEAFENTIFYAMNMEHDKAYATRSKWLSQKSSAQKIAAEVVRRSPHLGESNIETVTNTLSKNNPRLAAFNTISNGFEEAWADISDEDVPAVVDWFVRFWNALVKVLPDLGRLPLPKRQESRRKALTSWAITVQGYIRLARRFYNEELGFELLNKLAEKHVEPDGSTYDYFAWDNPEWQRRGIVVPAVNKSGNRTLTARNSHQSRRAAAEALASKVGLEAV